MIFRKSISKILNSGKNPKQIVDRIVESAESANPVEKFKEGEKFFWLIRWVIWETKNGSFSQYLCNSTGDDYDEALVALKEIGQTDSIEAFEELSCLFPNTLIPQNRLERVSLFNQTKELNGPAIAKLSRDFLNYELSLYESMINYAKRNPEKFRTKY